MSRVKEELREQIRADRGNVCDTCFVSGELAPFCFQRKKNIRKHPELASDPANIWMRCFECQKAWEYQRAAKRRPGAKVNDTFRKHVRQERGDRCERCGAPGPGLHLHHKQKQRTHPQIRCDRSNIVLVCQACHVILESELDAELRERSAVDLKSVANSDNARATNNSPTTGRKPGARVPGGESDPLSPGVVFRSSSLAKVAGAERPKASSSQDRQGAGIVYTQPQKSLELSVRERALALGLAPGSPRWRAYVLGTIAAARKRDRERRDKREK
jgi:hypothetical protein